MLIIHCAYLFQKLFCTYKLTLILFPCHSDLNETLMKVLLVFKIHKSKHKYSSFDLFLSSSSPSSILRVSAAACALSTSLSLKKRLFYSLVEPLEAPTPLLDITHTPTAQELLAHKVLQSLEEEKTESKRYG